MGLGPFRFGFFFAKVEPVVGITSLCPDGNHVLLLDFDDSHYLDVVAECQRLANAYSLHSIHIVWTGQHARSWHAWSFDKMPFNHLLKVLLDSELIDYAFIKWTAIRQKATLRISPKAGKLPLEARGYVKGNHIACRQQSLAHARLFERLFGIKVPLCRPDGSSQVQGVLYETVQEEWRYAKK